MLIVILDRNYVNSRVRVLFRSRFDFECRAYHWRGPLPAQYFIFCEALPGATRAQLRRSSKEESDTRAGITLCMSLARVVYVVASKGYGAEVNKFDKTKAEKQRAVRSAKFYFDCFFPHAERLLNDSLAKQNQTNRLRLIAGLASIALKSLPRIRSKTIYRNLES
jgi:hypothetical protein